MLDPLDRSTLHLADVTHTRLSGLLGAADEYEWKQLKIHKEDVRSIRDLLWIFIERERSIRRCRHEKNPENCEICSGTEDQKTKD